ncbi:unnamed protein product [Caenorhabditis bovis]|uniref:Pre-mRNA polyadenylation factor Fip1 domain-containing protein n=1 Tax=Caenorhabditis bovis TaxID=2654633 RepID=A0A8S1EBV9_9PELO|nr:unnamed protein product [Caenorhabditis bovis]
MEDIEALPPGLAPFDAESMETDEPANAEETSETKDTEKNEGEEKEENEDDDENPFADDDDSDEEGGAVQVTIRKVDTSQFNKPAHASQQGKLDLDGTPMVNDKPIYDIDLAQMEDRPWRQPGADITDYFNYGFNEDTWNLYCERQKKLRAEFGNNQAAANKALFSSIQVSNPLAQPIVQQSTTSTVKVLTDNGGRFKPHYQQNIQPSTEPIIRTVISGQPTQPPPNVAPAQIIDFSRPPPVGMPPMGIPGIPQPQMTMAPPPSSHPPSVSEAPPGLDLNSDKPPGIVTPPTNQPPVGIPGALDLNLGMPPPNFNPSMPPPGIGTGMPPPLGMMGPPGFNLPPPNFSQPQHVRAGFANMPTVPPPRGMGPPGSSFSSDSSRRESNDYDDDDERRRRKRSRSRSPSKRDRDRRRSDRDRGSDRSRRHRSRSASGDRKRHRDDRDRKDSRRDRRDDDESSKKKSRRRDDDDDRRKEKRSRHDSGSGAVEGSPNQD